MKLTGNNNYRGEDIDQVTEEKNATIPGTFTNHLIMTGIWGKIYEGNTICWPEGIAPGMEIVARATKEGGGNPAIIAYENQRSRIVIDTGFTKLWDKFDSAGTARYVINSVVWLTGLDFRLEHNLPLTGPIAK
jgi:hypothetical protein